VSEASAGVSPGGRTSESRGGNGNGNSAEWPWRAVAALTGLELRGLSRKGDYVEWRKEMNRDDTVDSASRSRDDKIATDMNTDHTYKGRRH
jgi:hypothetical protein